MIRAKRAFMIGGQEFTYGDTIPEEVILAERVPVLKAEGYIEVLPYEAKVSSVKTEKQVIKQYSEAGLENLKKSELRNIAEGLGIDTKGLTAQGITNAILKQQR